MNTVAIVDERTARCVTCGVVLRVLEPWQLHDLARRHRAESHPQTASPTPPPG